MSVSHAPSNHHAFWTAALPALLILEVLVTSCAGSEGEVGARSDDIDSGSSSNDTADANDAACELDSGSCAVTGELGCDDFEWCQSKTNHPIGLGLSSVWGSGASDVWVVGAAGSVIHWDGSKWASIPVATDWSLQAVYGTGPNDIWTVSAVNKIFHTAGFADDTAQWSPVNSIWDGPGTEGEGIVRAIWGTSPSDIWIGGNNFRIYRPNSSNSSLIESVWRSVVVDGSFAWEPIRSMDNDGPSRGIRGMWGSGPEDVWVVGSKGPPLLPFAAHTNGAAAAADGGVPIWTEFDTQSIAVLYAIWGSDSGNVWAVGDYGAIRHFTAGAEAWSIVDSPTTESLRGVWGAGSDDIWAVGEHGTLLHYDGMTWRPSTGAFPSGGKPNLYSVWGSGPADVWAVGSGIVMHFSGSKPGAQGATP